MNLPPMNLLIDLGNTRLKWAQSGSGTWLSGGSVYQGEDMPALLDRLWRELKTPARVVMVSVAADDARRALERWLQDRWSMTAQRVLARDRQLDVINTYRDPAALGADRWAALLGARGLTKDGCAVIDCGTAVTVDALTSEGVFAGGAILPGLGLMRRSLGAGTAGVGVAEGDDGSCLAHATADGVAAGTLFGLAGAIERCFGEFQPALGESFEVLITGGDAATVASRIARPTMQVPDLVLKGLARVAES